MSERKRAGGFVLMDAAFTADAKFIRLARFVPDPVEFAACVGVFWLLLADCRRAKSPAIDWEDYPDYSVQIEKLRSARLLDETGFDPEPFERWAPAYRSSKERMGTEGYRPAADGTQRYPTVSTVPNGIPDTKSTKPSGQVISNQVSTGVGGAGEGAPQSFMRYRPKPSSHDGQHPGCSVCAPLRPQDGAA